MKLDHIYKHLSFSDYLKLDAYLPINKEKVVIHPGKRECRFSMLDNAYLEFIHERTIKGFFYNRGFGWDGLALKYEGDMHKLRDDLGAKGIEAEYSHRPYKWKEGAKGPGWHFIDFPQAPFKKLHFWIIKYDPTGVVKKKKELTGYKLDKVSINSSEEGKKFLSKIIGNPKGDIFELENAKIELNTDLDKKAISSISILIDSLEKITLPLDDGHKKLVDENSWDISFMERPK